MDEHELQRTVAAPARGRFEFGFWVVAFTYVVVMAVTTAPSPLYGLYQQRDGFSTFTITLIFASYSLGSTSSLFLLGHISDWFGRKWILLPGIVVSAAGVLVFLLWRDLLGLYVGRVLGGLSVGMVSATATAYLGELHARSKPQASMRRAQMAGTVFNAGGLAVGALIAGLLAQYVHSPLTIPWVVLLAALGVAFVAVASIPETRARVVPRPAYRPQRITVPAGARGQFFAATGAAGIAFAGLGLFTGLAGVILVETLHRTSLALSGATVFAVFASGVAFQFVSMAWSRRAVLRTGMGLLLAGLGLVVTSVWLPSPNLALFLIGGVVMGMGSGAIFKGSLGTVMMIADPDHRAESLAGLLLAGYLGLSVPAIGMGVALRQVSPKVTLLGFSLVVVATLIAAAPALLRADRSGVASSPSRPTVPASTPPSALSPAPEPVREPVRVHAAKRAS
jgi:predicted MFS family arabinose efflux permease